MNKPSLRNKAIGCYISQSREHIDSLEAYAILDTYVVATYVDNREQCTTEALNTVAVLLMSSGAVTSKKKVTDG